MRVRALVVLVLMMVGVAAESSASPETRAHSPRTSADARVRTEEDVPHRSEMRARFNTGGFRRFLIVEKPSDGVLELGKRRCEAHLCVQSYVYVPDPDWFGEDRFRYRILRPGGKPGRVKIVRVQVNPVNDAPAAIQLSGGSVSEGVPAGTPVGTLTVVDPDGDPAELSLTSGSGDEDNGSFALLGGQLITTTVLDHEAADVAHVRIRAEDPEGLFIEVPLEVAVVDVNETPESIELSNLTVLEGLPSGTVVGTLSTVDPDVDEVHTYSLRGLESGLFQIVGDQLRTARSFDYESKTSADVLVRSVDSGGLVVEEVLRVNILDVSDWSPAGNRAPTDVGLSTASIVENAGANTTVGTLSSVDPNLGDTHTYALVAGAGDSDNGSFALSGADLIVVPSLNFENKSTYTVRIRSTDSSGGVYDEAMVITVTNANDVPTDITIADEFVVENVFVGAVVGTLDSVDEDSADSHTYSLVAGTGDDDNGDFTLDGDDLKVDVSPNFEAKSSYSVRIQTDDGSGGTHAEAITVTVTNDNEPPTGIGLSASTVNENVAIGTSVGTLSATGDPDSGASHTFSLVSGTGDTDNASFSIDGNQLELEISPNYEAKSSYSVRIRASDGLGGTFTDTFTITVTNVNEAPTSIAITNYSFNSYNVGTVVGTISATDPEGSAGITFSAISGTINGLPPFVVDGNLLKVGTTDVGFSGAWGITIRATDSGGLSFDQNVIICNAVVNPACVGGLN
jgi:hypothetical protein